MMSTKLLNKDKKRKHDTNICLFTFEDEDK